MISPEKRKGNKPYPVKIKSTPEADKTCIRRALYICNNYSFE